jgi:hypothetical protein
MKNIIWQQTDGTLAVTFITPEVEAQMDAACSLYPLIGEERGLKTKQRELTAAITKIKDEIYQLSVPLVPVDDSDEAATEARRILMLARGDQLAAKTQAWEGLHDEAADAATKLKTIDRIRLVSSVYGITSGGHAQILLAQKAVPDDWTRVACDLDWPTDGWPHECYRWVDDSIQVDIEAARLHTKKRLRTERTAPFAALDLKMTYAQEEGESTAEIVKEKRRLRALPDLADTAETLEDLQALHP